MKKLYIIFYLILICLFFSSCRHQETYRLLNEENQISTISIISISFDESGDVIQTELQEIKDKDAFLKDFRKVDCYTYYGDPKGVTEEGVNANAIKILYENDEYELINWKGQANYTSQRGFCFYKGYSVFDETQFESLVSEYLSAKS